MAKSSIYVPAKLEHYWNTFNAVAAVDKATNACPVYTLCPHQKRPPFYFFNDCQKSTDFNIFGMLNPEKI